jgi:hypothetical protein
MAVVQITESPEGRSFAMRYQNRRIVRVYERTYDVFTNYDGTGQLEVATTLGLPRLGDFYLTPSETDTGAFVNEVRPEQDGDDPYHWKVRVSYSSDVEPDLTTDGKSDSPANAKGNPLLRPAVVSYATRVRKAILEWDYHFPNRPIINSAGERFDPPIEVDAFNTLMTIQRNTIAFDPSRVGRLKGCVNSKPWNGVPVRCAKINDWVADQREEDGLVYFTNRIEVEVQYPLAGAPTDKNGKLLTKGGWDMLVLNRGTLYLTGDGNYTPVRRDENALSFTDPVLLDEKGLRLPKTVVTSGLFAAGLRTVTVKEMLNITVGRRLRIDSPTTLLDVTDEPIDPTEDVTVTAVTGGPTGAGTFTATFTSDHDANCFVNGVPTYLVVWPCAQIDFNTQGIYP